jgi:threonine dehydratase
LDEIRTAAAVIAPVARRTPVTTSRFLSDGTGALVTLKAEHVQRTGSFKIRGAYNRIAAMDAAERRRGVVAASAGNHAQGVALAARMLEVPATVFMPADASIAKVEATRGYGAHVELTGASFDDAQTAAQERILETGATFVSAFDDELVIAGQGTLGLELTEQVADAEVVVIPCGGGGLLAGSAIALKALLPGVRVVGVQAVGCAPMLASRGRGSIQTAERAGTIADGIAVKRPGRLTFPLVQEHVDELVSVTDEEITAAIALLLEREKQLVEGAGAVGAAALMHGRVADIEGRRVVVVLSGGNIDLPLIQSVIRRGLTVAGRYMVLRTRITDRPGSLLRLLGVLAADRVNIIDVTHHREGVDIYVTETEVELTVETRDAEHRRAVLDLLTANGYEAERVR